jgi:hypothetical protein
MKRDAPLQTGRRVTEHLTPKQETAPFAKMF